MLSELLENQNKYQEMIGTPTSLNKLQSDIYYCIEECIELLRESGGHKTWKNEKPRLNNLVIKEYIDICIFVLNIMLDLNLEPTQLYALIKERQEFNTRRHELKGYKALHETNTSNTIDVPW